MKKIAIALLICSASAFAGTVDYTTTGEFLSDSGTSVTLGDATIKFEGTVGSVSTPTFSSLGTFVVTGNVGATFSDSFTLTIDQTVPSVGNQTSSTTIAGTITGNSSTILLTFVPSAVTIGSGASTATYTFSPDVYGLNNPSVNSGDTTIEAYITSSPEPASIGLLGGSLLGLGFMIRRRSIKK
jgi:hypothetical protein